jgi:predicted phosphodiesterase
MISGITMLFLHISDIHFKRSDVGQPDDPNRALRNDMIEDVKIMRGRIGRSADGIIISGDIAYHGVSEEYDFAYKWLESELCPAAGCTLANVFVVPGNHDVDRSQEAGPAQSAARQSLRTIAVRDLDNEVRQWLRDKTSANVIFGPLESYNRFAANFLCNLRPYCDADDAAARELSSSEQPALPFARREVPLSDNSRLRIWGFSTVIVSDEHDGKDKMIIDPAAAQIEAEDGVSHMVVCHHPFNWLRNGGPFADRVNKVGKIQLFGHEHTQRMDEDKRYLRVRAGALQPARDEPDWKPGYNWLDIDVGRKDGKRALVVQVWVRMHETNRFLIVTDPDGKEVWENAYPLPDWTAPAASDSSSPIEESAEAVGVTMSPSEPAISVRTVTLKFFKLKEHEQRRVIAQLELDREGDRELRDYEQVISAVRRAKAGGLLAKLDAVLDETLKGDRTGK